MPILFFMLACVDVHYEGSRATAAAVLFESWTAAEPARDVVHAIEGVAAYEPGAFFKRELPCVLAALKTAGGASALEAIVIDGYVTLSPTGAAGQPARRGLGMHLHDAIGRAAMIVGVAKTSFHSATHAIEVFRGQSRQPLYVTAMGMNAKVAAEHVRTMHGEHRIPTMLKRVARLCRGVG